MPDRLPCGLEGCERDFKTEVSRDAHHRRIHGIYKRGKHKPRITAAPTAPQLGATVKVVELSLDPDENIVAVLANGTARWRAVIFETVQ